jgi:phage recombination protein Bet
MTELVTTSQVQSPAIKQWDENYAALIKQTVLKPSERAKRAATDVELALFAEQCVRSGLNPFLRQIYGIYRYDSRAGGEVMQVQVAIDGLRLIAERTGKYEGQTPVQWCGPEGAWVDVWLKDEPPAAARVGVHKRGLREPMYATALWREFRQTHHQTGELTGRWIDMPSHMLAKCAEALALRKAFPAEMSGLYTDDELPADTPVAEPPPITPSTPAADAGEPVEGDVLLSDEERAKLVAAFAAAGFEEMTMFLTAAGLESTDNLTASDARKLSELLGQHLAQTEVRAA